MNAWYWEFLGVKPNASEAEIHQAYRRLSKLFHPDRGGTDQDMARLNQAYALARKPPVVVKVRPAAKPTAKPAAAAPKTQTANVKSVEARAIGVPLVIAGAIGLWLLIGWWALGLLIVGPEKSAKVLRIIGAVAIVYWCLLAIGGDH